MQEEAGRHSDASFAAVEEQPRYCRLMGAESQRYFGRHLDSRSVANAEENYSMAVPSIFRQGVKTLHEVRRLHAGLSLQSKRKRRHRGRSWVLALSEATLSQHEADMAQELTCISRCRYSNTARPLRDIRFDR